MSQRTIEIDRLTDHLNWLYSHGHFAEAEKIADELKNMLGTADLLRPFRRRDAEIVHLSSELTRLYCNGEFVAARTLAEKLAAILGDPTPENVQDHVHSWVQVWEARGNLEEATRIAELDINSKRVELDSGTYADFPELLYDEVEYLQDSLYLQAERYEKLGRHAAAVIALSEVFTLTKQYGVEIDNDVISLYAKLTS